MKSHDTYGNIPVYSPTGILMFKTNERKLQFYKRNNLIETYQTGFRLLFQPKGLGYHNSIHKGLLLLPRQNRCVVSGEENISLLTRHHIIPVLFRKWMPMEIKSSDYQSIVFVRKDLHHQYTRAEQKYYNVVANKYNVVDYKDSMIYHDKNFLHKKSCINTLLHYSHFIPDEKLKILKTRFVDFTGYPATIENYVKIWEEIQVIKKRYYKNADYNFGKSVVEKIIDYNEFEKMWLDHFVSTMNPQYLPEDLKLLL